MSRDLEKIYTYHKPTENTEEKYKTIRAKGKDIAAYILANCPDSRERTIALDKVEEVIMWANASIARHTV
jgi:hypothetical protein